MEVFVALIGLGLVAVAPRIQVLRPAIRAVIKTWMAVTEASVTAAAVITEQVSDLVAHARADHGSHTIVGAEAAHEAADAAPEVSQGLDNTDLLQIDGIGPKVSGHLKNAGVRSITQLAATRVERLQEILDAAGPRFGAIDPSTWPVQAQALLAGGRA